MWNSYSTSLIYVARKEIAPPRVLFRSMIFTGNFGDPVLLQLGAIICLPSLLLLALFRKLLTSEVILSQIRKL
jgi:hypothetical protein